jgi:hypothetical protein
MTGSELLEVPSSLSRYASLAAMRKRHAELVRSLPRTSGAQQQGLSTEHFKNVQDFLARGAATGVILDDPEEREIAQGLLDYWKATLYSHAPQPSAGATATTQAPYELPQTSSILADFDSEGVQGLAQDATRIIEAMSPEQQQLAWRVLQRLIQMADQGPEYVITPIPWKDVECVADARQVEAVLMPLRTAGVVYRTKDGRLQLALEALVRRWPGLAQLLEKRRLFRDAALFWDRHHRDAAALVAGSLLKEAEGYRDLNKLEHEFVNASEAEAKRLDEETQRTHRKELELKYTRRLVRAWRIVGILVGLSLVLVVGFVIWQQILNQQLTYAYIQLYEANQKTEELNRQLEAVNRELAKQKRSEEKARKKAQSERLLWRTLALVQLLPEILEANTSAKREIARIHLKYPPRAILEDPLVNRFLKDSEGTIAAIFDLKENNNAPNHPAVTFLVAERQEFLILEITRRWRNQLLDLKDDEVKEVLKSIRRTSFGTLGAIAQQLASGAEKGKTLRELDAFRREYWKLYWGKLGLVEGHKVESAQVYFGQAVRLWETKMDEPASAEVQAALRTCLRQLQDAMDEEDKGDLPPYPGNR